MKTASYGRIVFGASAVLFGVIALMWHDSDTWQTLRQIWSLPFGIIAAPTMYATYGSFFEQFSLLCGSTALYAATEANAARAVAFGRLARLGLGVSAISFTLGQIFYLRVTAELVPRWIPPNQMFWAILTTIAFALAAIAILIHCQARLATRLLTLMLALFGVLVWIPRLIAHPEAHLNWSEFALTFLITGAAWMVADLRSF